MWGRLQPGRDFSPAGETRMNAAAGAKAPPQAEACPTWTGGPTLAQKCEVIPAPALSTALEFACASWSRLSAGSDGLRAGVSCCSPVTSTPESPFVFEQCDCL